MNQISNQNFDEKKYIKTKIMNKLKESENYDVKFNDSVSELIENVNVSLWPQNSDTFEESVIGWVNFCNIVKDLVVSNLTISLENFKSSFLKQETGKKIHKSFITSERPIDESLLIEEDSAEKTKRLLEISESVDLIDDEEEEFLSEEGLRSRGLISQDATSLDGEEVAKPSSGKAKVLRLEKGEEIVSPYTGTTHVCQINSTLWMDIDTEETFYVYFS